MEEDAEAVGQNGLYQGEVLPCCGTRELAALSNDTKALASSPMTWRGHGEI